MSTLFEIFGFLSVVLRGLDFVAQSVLLGSVTFAAFVATPLAGDVEERGLRRVFAGCRRVIRAAALATIVAVITATVLNAAVLAASLEISWREVAGAGFVIAGAGKVVLAAVIGLLGSAAAPPPRATRNALAAAGALFLCAALADTHAAARLTNNGLLLPKAPRRPQSSRRHDGRVVVHQSDTRWCSDGFEIGCENGEK